MNTARVKERLQQILKQRGVRGLIGLQQSFHDFDLDKNGSLSWEEFNFALQKSGLAPSPQDTRALFLEFDADGNNEISYDEFLTALRGNLSAKRRNIITRIFEGIDSDGDGVISMTDIGSCFNPKNHPDVTSGKTTVPVFLNDFFETFNTVTTNGYVTLQQFLEYYANSAAFEDDATFESMMASVWSVSKNSTKQPLKKQSLQSLAEARTTDGAGESKSFGEPAALSDLRSQLISRGAKGIIGLARKFRIFDDDGSKSLTLSEFKKGIKDCSINLTDNDLNRLFQYFDSDRSGSINYDEFLKGIRGPMSQRRKQLVGMAFSKMDKSGNGFLDPEDVIDTYDASKHPDVLAGKRTPDEVLREFLDTFDVGGERDGKVTRNEFENYYANVSASIDDDDYFELMIRNAWHISGGEGWSANTANRRVLVTHADGRQTVEEIKDDLGLKNGDQGGALTRLRAQGINASNISYYDGLDTRDAEVRPPTAAILGKYRSTPGPKNIITGHGIDVPQTNTGRRQIAQSSSLVADAMQGLSLMSQSNVSPSPYSSNTNTGINPLQPANIKSAPNPGLQMIIAKFKESLKERGSIGFIGLQRKFRIMDDDGSKSLNLAEFKKGIKEMRISVSDPEIRMLFDYFDTDRSGSINFEEFIQGVRDPLNERRLRLVHLAFSRLDKDGSGLVDAVELVNMFDPSKHPDVIAGKRSPHQVLEEFLDTFDVGGEKDGKVTRNEFENYYTNIGANIDNDDYFELMIRNAWHISGGEGWSANTANRRVLVTHADGRETVEEIKDDLGLKSGDKSGALARLSKQGMLASSISFHDGVETKNAPSKPKPSLSLRDASSRKSAPKEISKVSEKPSQNSSPDLEIALKGPIVRDPAPPTVLAASKSTVNAASVPDYGLQMIIKKIKNEMKSRGAHGFIGMQRKFRIMDDDGSKTLSMAEFKKAMNEMKIGVTEREMRMLFDYFDSDHSGTISFEEFIQGVRDPLNDRRRRLVHLAFSKLDKQNDGCVEPQDIIDNYDAKCHPDVISGKSTELEVMQEFLDTFDVGGEKDGKVTRNEFENYYTNIGANIDNDDYFELMIRNAWHISGGEGWSANTANRRVLVTHADGRETVEEIKDDLGLKSGDKSGMMARLRAQGIHASSIELFNSTDSFDTEAKVPSKKMFAGKHGAVSAPLGVLPGTGAPSYSKKSVGSPQTKKTRNIRPSDAPVAIQTIIAKLKSEMKLRGGFGFIGMQRRFRIMDDDGSKTLDMAEFRKAMKELNLGLDEAEIRTLFVYFDTDQSGTISFEEFIQGIREPLSEKRLALVNMAFKKLDKDRSGIVDAADIANMYDASKHPEVLAGRMTAEQAFKQFLDTFDVGGEKDGKVTRNEFENYYTNIGANIDNDDYFELMIRNAWHISGGEGWSANTANRRVLVTHADGRETVEEIKDDLGLKSDDKSGMMARLRAQGIDPKNIATYGEGEDNQKLSAVPSKPKSLGTIAKTSKTDPGRFGATAGSSTRGAPNLMRDTLQLNQTERATSTRSKDRGEMDYGLKNIIRQFKAEIKARGSIGFIGLQRKFRIMDDDGSKSLNLAEFKKGIKEMRISVSDPEIRMLFDYFDTDRSGSINFEEFIQGVRDPLNERRKSLVQLAFNKLDKDGSGLLDGADLIDKYDASKHPDVIAGKRTPDEIMEEFLDTFDVGGEKDGKVTRNEFENYYTNIGANIDNDDYFELMIRNAWHISGGEGWSANTANRRVLVTHADGRETVEEIKDDLGLKSDDKSGMMARLRAQGIQSSSINLFGGYEEKPQPNFVPSSFKELVEQGRAGKSTSQATQNRPSGKKRSTNTKIFESSVVIGDDGEANSPHSKRNLKGGISRIPLGSNLSGAAPSFEHSTQPGSQQRNAHPSSLAHVSQTRHRDLTSILDELKKNLATRGVRGIVGLARKFRILDDDSSGLLSMAEFKKGMRETSLELSEQDYRILFSHFDKDGNGAIDYEELVAGLRGDLSQRRKQLVGMAFSKMDKSGNGFLDPEDVIDTYDASKHPDVLAGKRTPDEVLREFLDTFDVGGERDGKVTRNEFENYYANVSASIDDDDYFELMIRNAWHISGGEGWSANTANRRVLVTHADGRQTVEEIKDDLGLKSDDTNGMLARLRAQGIKAANISLHDGVGLKKKGTTGPSPTYKSQFTIG